jgi:segregation and condensation protein B
MDLDKIKSILEAALMAADEPLSTDRLVKLFKRGEVPLDELREAVKEALTVLEEECAGRGYELRRVASGYRYQVRQEYSEWVSRLWEEKPPRYSRALMETLALIVYKQPVTRGDVEQVRGVAVSQNILRTLLERGWIRVVGTRDVPGKPAMYGTTKAFLDYFNLKSLGELPPLDQIRDMLGEEPALDDDDQPEQKALPELDENGDPIVAEANPGLEDADGMEADDAQDDEADDALEVRVEVDVIEAPEEQVAEEDPSLDGAQGSDGEAETAHLAKVVQLPTQSG